MLLLKSPLFMKTSISAFALVSLPALTIAAKATHLLSHPCSSFLGTLLGGGIDVVFPIEVPFVAVPFGFLTILPFLAVAPPWWLFCRQATSVFNNHYLVVFVELKTAPRGRASLTKWIHSQWHTGGLQMTFAMSWFMWATYWRRGHIEAKTDQLR